MTMMPYETFVQWSVACNLCEASAFLDIFRVRAGDDIPRPKMREDWRVLDGMVLCPRHMITITDKEGKQG